MITPGEARERYLSRVDELTVSMLKACGETLNNLITNRSCKGDRFMHISISELLWDMDSRKPGGEAFYALEANDQCTVVFEYLKAEGFACKKWGFPHAVIEIDLDPPNPIGSK